MVPRRTCWRMVAWVTPAMAATSGTNRRSITVRTGPEPAWMATGRRAGNAPTPLPDPCGAHHRAAVVDNADGANRGG
jgi:hypothetical protein